MKPFGLKEGFSLKLQYQRRNLALVNEKVGLQREDGSNSGVERKVNSFQERERGT